METSLILVIDDDEAILQLIGHTLRKENFEVILASSPTDAARILASTKPSLIISDLLMEPIDGFAFIESQLGPHPQVPVIMLTSVDNLKVVSRAASLGIRDYVLKPFKAEDLLTKVKSLL